MAKNLDLLGDPIPDNWGGRGRPAHIPTSENRNKIRLLLAFGWANVQIARALRITKATMRKHYLTDLKHRDEARPALEAAHKMAVYKAAIGGNVGAMKELGRLIEKDELSRVLPSAAQEPRPERRGKKETADLEAQSADEGTGWHSLMH